MISILIVDDEFHTREGLSTLISRSGLPITTIKTACNGIQGLDVASQLHPDILITDVRMPHMNGIELASELKKFLPGCQIIFLSGYSDKEYLKSAIELRATNYIEKPVNHDELIATLQNSISALNENKKNQIYVSHKDNLVSKAALELTSFNAPDSDIETLTLLEPVFSKQPVFYTLLVQLKCNDLHSISSSAIEKIHSAISSFSAVIAQKKDNLFLVHLGTASQQIETAMQCARQIQLGLSDISECFIAIGSPACDLRHLASSYFDAVICLKKLFFTGYDHICCYNVSDSLIQSHYTFDTALLDKFDSALRSDDFASVSGIVSSLFTDIHKTIYKFECNELKNIYYQFITHLSSIALERQIYNLFTSDSAYLWENISSKDTLFDLHDYLLHKIDAFKEEVQKSLAQSPLMHNICQYIELHFQDSSLSVNQLAKELHFTPAYLCQVFKAQAGTTINSYINSFRINKSKELLQNKDNKLYEISVSVGYNSPDQFTKYFKKYVGITPSEYRERYLL